MPTPRPRDVAALVAVAALMCSRVPADAAQGVDGSARSGFDVASVKPSASDAHPLLRALPDRFDAVSVPLSTILGMAFDGLQPYQILGLPSWAGERFDVQAKTDRLVRPQEMVPMLRALLVERFKLATHSDTRELPVYALTVARRELGPGMQRSTADCGALLHGLPAAEVLSPSPTERVPCGSFSGATFITAGDQSMGGLAAWLSRRLDRPVLDRTGLSGHYDFQLTFASDTPAREPALGDVAAPPTPDGPSIFVALQEQLGLTLETQRAPLEVLIIDHIERPESD